MRSRACLTKFSIKKLTNMTELVYSFSTTIIFLYLLAYLPGSALVKRYNSKLEWDFKCAIGLSLLALVLFFGKFILPTTVICGIILAITVSILYRLPAKKAKKKNQSKVLTKSIPAISKALVKNAYIITPIIVGSLLMALPYIQSAIHGPLAVQNDILRSHDQSWHASVIKGMLDQFPPETPGFAGVTLKNYHYFYDLIIASNVEIFHSSIEYSLQLVYPMLIAIFFGTAVYRLSSILTKNKTVITTSILLSYIGGNYIIILSLLTGKSWHVRDLILDQPVYFLFNHQTVLTIALLSYILILLSNLIKNPQSRFTQISLIILSSALLSFKIYAIALLAAVFAITGLYYLAKARTNNTSFQIIKSLAQSSMGILIISLGTIALNFRLGNSFLHLDFPWVTKQFIERVVIPSFPQYTNQLTVYQRSNTGFEQLVVLGIISIVFLVLSIGYRFLAILMIAPEKKSPLLVLLAITSLISISIPFFGYQATSPFNIIQFAPYGMTYLTIITLFVLSKQSKIIQLVGAILILISLPPTVAGAKEFIRYHQHIPDTEMIEIVEFLQQQPPGLIISTVEPDQRSITTDDGERKVYDSYSNNLINAISPLPVYYSDWLQLEVLQLPHKTRRENIDLLDQDICNFSQISEPLFDQYNNLYIIIYLDKENNGCIEDSTNYNATKVYGTPYLSVIQLSLNN